MIPSGMLRDRVTILWPEWARGAIYDEQQATWNVRKTVHAKVVFQRGSEALTVAETWMTRLVTVLIRWHGSIHDRCRLVWQGRLYKIESLNEDTEGRSITIVASVLDEAVPEVETVAEVEPDEPTGTEATEPANDGGDGDTEGATEVEPVTMGTMGVMRAAMYGRDGDDEGGGETAACGEVKAELQGEVPEVKTKRRRRRSRLKTEEEQDG